jgi:hypothetical protein
MTDHPPNRLWPLALMGWLAAFPPQGREAAAGTPDTPRLEQPGPAGNPAPPAPAALPAEAPRRRRRRRPAA